jgi:acyl-[acyl-carrier-protein]-phospholipid O-acyltransferase / long-chain-fatty-acid--[acyl-carrier-protein] ligase
VEAPDAARGSRVVAVVTEGVDEREVLRQMAGDLAKIALPKQFVVVPELPKMPSGKIDYRRLTETVRELIHRA